MKTWLALLFLFASFSCIGQNIQATATTAWCDAYYTDVERPSHFPGGSVALERYIYQNLEDPSAASGETKLKGKVVLGFMTDKTGTIKDVQVIESMNEAYDLEAVRLLKSMPDWVPAEHQVPDGWVKVCQSLTINIAF